MRKIKHYIKFIVKVSRPFAFKTLSHKGLHNYCKGLVFDVVTFISDLKFIVIIVILLET